MTEPASSFRDPAGFCCSFEGRILRVVSQEGADNLETFRRTFSAREWMSHGRFVATRRLNETERAALLSTPGFTPLVGGRPNDAIFEHERIPFASFPHEWPAEMLWEAGRLTLNLAAAVLDDGYGLKDATPNNVMFRGGEAVFLDALSFERRAPGDPMWKPYAQFVRTFLLPLLAAQGWNMRMADIFGSRRDGLEPDEVYHWCGPLQRFSPRMLSLVSIPTWLSRKTRPDEQGIYRDRTMANAEKARFVVQSLFKRLQRTLNSLQPPVRKQSNWSDYMATHSYSDPAFEVKERFVKAVLQRCKPARVLDVGANTGHFSALAAQAGAGVVAIDLDPACVGTIWSETRARKLNVLPLVVNLAWPTPGLGWRNRECPAFLDRARGSFDGVLMLAVIHHLLVTERVPLEEILRLAAELTTSVVIIEFGPPQDEMFRRLARGRDHLHASLTEPVFEQACAAHFSILSSAQLPGTHRKLYCLKRKGGAQ